MGRETKSETKSDHNRLFNRNEHKILLTVFKLFRLHRGRITVRKVAEVTSLSRQTIYNHHPDIDHALVQSEENLLNEFAAKLDISDKKFSKMIRDPNRRIFYAVLIFMNQHKDIFCLICVDINNQRLLHQIVAAVFPRLKLKWLPAGTPAPDISDERVSMYMRMLVEVISRWGIDTHCDIRKADRYIDRMIRITEAAEQNRLP